MSLFRPCIDLHDGKVKQIVGGTLSDSGSGLKTNFESERGADYFAGLYRRDGLSGGHVHPSVVLGVISSFNLTRCGRNRQRSSANCALFFIFYVYP